MGFKLIIFSCGFWLSCNGCIIMGVELSTSSHIHKQLQKKSDQHNFSEIGKSVEMSEERHFSVKVPWVQCWPGSIRKGSVLGLGKHRLFTCAAVGTCWQAAEGWNETLSRSSLKGQNSHSRQTSSGGCPQFAMISSLCPPVRMTGSLSRTGNYFSLFLDTFWVSSCLRCGFKWLL